MVAATHGTQQATGRRRFILLLAVAVQLLIAYMLMSLAFNSGSLWQYGLTLVFIMWGLRSFIQLAGTFVGKNRR